MSVSYNVYVGRYIKVKNFVSTVTTPTTIKICSNDVDCKNYFSNKDLENSKFCPECGSKVIPYETTIQTQRTLDAYDICKDLFGNGDKLCCNENVILYNTKNKYHKTVYGNCTVDLNVMSKNISNKTEDDEMDILSKHLTKIGVENEIKFGAFGYYC